MVSIPGSKSLTNRALILAALGKGETTLHGALWSEDTELMIGALNALGFKTKVEPDPSNDCNRVITVEGKNGEIPAPAATIDVGTAGTVARFVSALCSLGKGSYKLHGTERMHKRPMKEIFSALRELGAQVNDSNGFLPAEISGPISGNRSIRVDESESSQFASALLLISKVKNIKVECSHSPYIEMTRQQMKEWETSSSIREIEMDHSSASYFLALKHLHHVQGFKFTQEKSSGIQMDDISQQEKFWTALRNHSGSSPFQISRKADLGDSILTIIIGAFAWQKPFRLVEGERLRVQECDRISAMVTELKKCGARVEEHPDGLALHPPHQFRPATIDTYKDHRIAMCFAALGTVDALKNGQPWLTIKDPSCVVKTFPNFFESLKIFSKAAVPL